MFEPINALERLLVAAATDAKARPAFVGAFLQSEVFLSPAGDPPSEDELGPIVVANLANGETAAAVFTARERLFEVVGPDARVAALTGRELLEQARGEAVQVNPGLSPSVVWSPDDIEQILGPGDDVAVGTQILLSHPMQQPTELIGRLRSGLTPLAQIKAAWILQAHRSDQADPMWLLGVEHSGDWAEVDQAIASSIRGLKGEKPLQALSLTGDGLSQQLRRGIPVVAPKGGLPGIS
ncbi:MAG: enhanced serine sensitivity protein SseB C-terminal domain-containing protein [Caulobacteraceae bacterium]